MVSTKCQGNPGDEGASFPKSQATTCTRCGKMICAAGVHPAKRLEETFFPQRFGPGSFSLGSEHRFLKATL